MSDPETAICCMIVSNPGGGERPHAWQKRVNDHMRALAAKLEAVTAERDALNEVLAEKRRLTRELDVAMHGEEGAAKQASLCDLVEPARLLRARAAEAEARLALDASNSWEIGREAGLREAAGIGYRVCAETRHVTLAWAVEDAILACIQPKGEA